VSELDAGVPSPEDDRVYPFQIDKIGVRGRLVRLGEALDRILTPHDYPEPVAILLGEVVGLCIVLSSTLKFDGVFSLQIRGNGPVKAVVADLETPGGIRGYASFDETAAAALKGPMTPAEIFGNGLLTWTVDQGQDTERYQGIVPLEGDTLAACLESYFRRSEQLRAVVRVGVARVDTANQLRRWRGGAIMAQNLATEGGHAASARPDQPVDDASWDHARALVGSTTVLELCDPALPPAALLRRLFHEDGVWVYEPETLEARCRCSKERIEAVLSQFSEAEVAEMVTKSGKIEVRCEFCSKTYHLDGVQRS